MPATVSARPAGTLHELHRSRAVPHGNFRIITTAGRATYLRGNLEGSFGSAVSHAQLCARVATECHRIPVASAEVVDGSGRRVYLVEFRADAKEVTR